MKLHSFVIFTENITLLRAFYEKCLGMTVTYDYGNCIGFNTNVAIWKIPEGHKLSEHVSKGKVFELSFETKTFESDLESLSEFDVKWIHNVQEESWGQKTIRFFDPDGNIIELGEDIPSFIRRMSKEGMSLNAIANKSSVPLLQVKAIIEGDGSDLSCV